MAHLTDERGNPIQLTDEFGNPVTLTDEHGNRMHLSGVAYATDTPNRGGHVTSGTTVGEILSGGDGGPTSGTTVGGPDPVEGMGVGHGPLQPPRVLEEVGGTTADIRRSSSSSSTSSEEEVGEGELVEGEERGTRRRRKKKGITQKIKEKLSLTGSAKAKDAGHQTTTVTTSPTDMAVPRQIATTDTTTQKMTTEHVEKEKGGAFVARDTTTTTVTTEHRDQAKKGVFEKIKEKLPGHHSTH